VTGTPLRAAAAVIFDTDRRLLLVKENYDRRRWSLPGGAVEPGESDEDAAIRETIEETGVLVRIQYLIGSYALDSGVSAAAFLCSIVEGTPAVPSTGEIAEVKWWPATEVPWPRSKLLHYAVPDAVAGLCGVERVGLPRIS
jgi:8-oxo-dGTP pyrophosphatase MutT (NUDIX family)